MPLDPRTLDRIEGNDLAEFLMNFKTWWGKHGSRVLTLALVVLVVLLGKQLLDKRSKGAFEAAWGALAQTTSPEGALELATSYDDATFRAKARLRAGDLFVAGAAKLAAEAATQPAQSKTVDARGLALKNAAEVYQQVVSDTSTPAVFRLHARFGLATAAEAADQFKDAGEQYTLIQQEAGSEYPALRQLAAAHLAYLDRLAKPVRFGPEPTPPPAPPAASQPAEALPPMLPGQLPAGDAAPATP